MAKRTERFHCVMPPALMERLRRAAEEDGRTITAVVEAAVRAAFDKRDKTKAKAKMDAKREADKALAAED